MLGAFLGQTPGLFDRRFLLHLLLPSLGFCLSVSVVLAGSGLNIGQALRTWEGMSGSARALAGLALLLAAGLLASALSGCRTAICRLFEGYWTGFAAEAALRQGVAWHRRRCDALHRAPVSRDGALSRYPLPTRPEDFRPTRLGNVLRSAEQYPQVRYSMDAVVVWPRLYQILPDPMTATLAAARADLDAGLGLSVLCLLFGVVGAVEVLWEQGPWSWFLVLWWGGCFAAYLAYRSALAGASVYAQHVRVAFDLHRYDLIRQLGDEPPSSPEEERDYWYRLCQFWHRGIPRDHVRLPAASGSPLPAPVPDHTLRIPLPVSGYFWTLATALGVAGAVSLGLY
ncbi:hypothetical protein [Streptomyces avidinii]|uniref:Uncharacterized protein n=1 Tax=Streptomyces avidinii TaxID=1895 RepID=A0ABS4L060_STRAV|nr:hypothetical protein [Streptomyces avidinii]MBP2035300.1 hypothetical protein [Streptomyces avidinii]GGZ03457.1 hypothetical protein GCM10010343_31580 [Streptomyces avidinii]